MTNLKFTDASLAIDHACRLGPMYVGWLQKTARWIAYSPMQATPRGCEPQFFCFMSPRATYGVATPLNDDAIDVMFRVKRIKVGSK